MHPRSQARVLTHVQATVALATHVVLNTVNPVLTSLNTTNGVLTPDSVSTANILQDVTTRRLSAVKQTLLAVQTQTITTPRGKAGRMALRSYRD